MIGWRGTARAATHPLVRAVLGQIVKDEAAHGRFGWIFLDWVLDELGTDDRHHLETAAQSEIGKLEASWAEAAPRLSSADVFALDWMESSAYYALARSSIEVEVKEPLRAGGLLSR